MSPNTIMSGQLQYWNPITLIPNPAGDRPLSSIKATSETPSTPRAA